MVNAPSPETIKCFLRETIPYGGQVKIANILGVTPGEISQRFNPDGDRKLWIAEGVREEWAIAGGAPTGYALLRTFLDAARDSWQTPVKPESLTALVVAADKEADDVIQAWATGKPVHVQRAQIVEAIEALKKCLKKLDCADGSNVAEIRR